uniref:carbonic anhydrase n=1 Tax=Amblyomma maculatum TaxID=34609 RepID=G3MQA7_AMBMU
MDNMCSKGLVQSPIKIADAKPATPPIELVVDYSAQLKTFGFAKDKFLRMTINDTGPKLTLGADKYNLKEVHFRIGADNTKGSEHEVGGSSAALEIQFVHIKDGMESLGTALMTPGNVLVMSALYKVLTGRQADDTDKADPTPDTVLTTIASNFDEKEGSIKAVKLSNALVTGNLKEFYTYKGSMTYPPCTEDVSWVVLSEPIVLADPTLKAIREKSPQPCSRPPKEATDGHNVTKHKA